MPSSAFFNGHSVGAVVMDFSGVIEGASNASEAVLSALIAAAGIVAAVTFVEWASKQVGRFFDEPEGTSPEDAAWFAERDAEEAAHWGGGEGSYAMGSGAGTYETEDGTYCDCPACGTGNHVARGSCYKCGESL